MEKQTQLELLKYELNHIIYFNKLEDSLKEVFGSLDYIPNVPCQNYTLFYMVLDDLGVPPDSSETPRDEYNNLYAELYWSRDISDKNIKNFINKIIRINSKVKNGKRR